ncbi:TAXI family TRAP transporter solute-binding subunit [Granulosicoccus antarcticus]|uniref:Uncharacterized protein n=1 Tax=Granulosicoccus antarcticus IMCC3135 TaxID=1192854 RepID=A0A2Z2NMI8_9GAMM|nr:TAXI family TRAP transporter solute-binding subunit [Granulosicoccus antarcticus]ASJ72586.1 hypothetical protein IMCC3135_12490 [Granulosicoccus antarcticus IMCC3135]
MRLLTSLLAASMLLGTATSVLSETRVTYKSAKTGSSYYQMAVELAEAMKTGTEGDISVTVEESQGSVQNVMEAGVRPGNYVFTSPPALVELSQSGKAMFEGKSNPAFANIRALFPIPSLTMHFVVSEESGIQAFADMEGKTILLGKGSFGATEGEKYLTLFDLEGKVKLAEVELSNAVAALKNGQIDGFVTAGSYPAPNVIEAAASTSVRLLSLDDKQVAATKRTPMLIPAGTYSGQDEDVATTSLAVVAYATTAMSDDIAYAMTRTYWEQKKAMAGTSAWWDGVDASLMESLGQLHPGAIRYYDEIGMQLSDAQRQ